MDVVGRDTEWREFRLALILPWSRSVLAENHDGKYHLPVISVPRWARNAENITSLLHKRWDLRSIVLEFLPAPPDHSVCALIEVRDRAWDCLKVGLVSIPLDEFSSPETTKDEWARVIKMCETDTKQRGSISRIGWIDEAQVWIHESIGEPNVKFSEDLRGANAGDGFALVRFGTIQGPAYWLKATSFPNTHELPVTVALASCLPAFLPPLIAAREDWNAWVTEETGTPICRIGGAEAFERAADTLARMQLCSIDYSDQLLASGCFDQRLSLFGERLPILFTYLEEAMGLQISTKAPKLSIRRLREIEYAVTQAMAVLQELGVPPALIHNDLNPNNILFDGTRVVFIDWAEGGVGCPFFTLQHLVALANTIDESQGLASKLKVVYGLVWRDLLGEEIVNRALALCPPLAIASYLVGRDTSFDRPARRDDRILASARSLTRYMDRFVQTEEFLEAL